MTSSIKNAKNRTAVATIVTFCIAATLLPWANEDVAVATESARSETETAVDEGVDSADSEIPAHQPEDLEAVFGASDEELSDRAMVPYATATGYELYSVSPENGLVPSLVAQLNVAGVEADSWIGNHCVLSGGDKIAAVYAPRTFTNSPELMLRGGFGAVIDIDSGAVTELGSGFSLAHYNPGCGLDPVATFVQYSDEGAGTQVMHVDGVSGALTIVAEIAGFLSDAVSHEGQLLGLIGDSIVRVRPDSSIEVIHDTDQPLHDLKIGSKGEVAALARDGDSASLFTAQLDSDLKIDKVQASSPVDVIDADLGLDATGVVHLATSDEQLSKEADGSGITVSDVPSVDTVSTGGGFVVTPDPTVVPEAGGSPSGEAQIVQSDESLKLQQSTQTNTVERSIEPARDLTAQAGMSSVASPSDVDHSCAVPRNDPSNQALQPTPRQVEWAVNRAVTGNLTATRPAGWRNLGMPAYSPQGYFPRAALDGGGRVPVQIMLGILAQESNLWQASRYALPGVSGNPLVGNYYGVATNSSDETAWWDIDFASADCGYGVAQVTDGMRKAGRESPGQVPALPYQQQRAIALDYQANIAAGLNILIDKWNQTRQAGLTINNGNPGYVENWFYALWAYNSGFYPEGAPGEPWGVGWLNNPANPIYDQSRGSFLDGSPVDASNPQRWPYPEKVLGFAAHSLELPESFVLNVPAFRTASWNASDGYMGVVNRKEVKPPLNAFCDESNDCVPGASIPSMFNGLDPTPCAHQDAAGNFDLKCWYHEPVTWKEDCPSTCGVEFIRFSPTAPDQPDGVSFPPNCTSTGLATNALIVDNISNDAEPVRSDCNIGTMPDSVGSFTFEMSAQSDGRVPARVDLHQLGGGFNSHFYFTHTRVPGTDAAAQGELDLKGVWNLGQPLEGWARVLVHMPDHGAWNQQAKYTVDTGNGLEIRFVPQRHYENRWVSLGVFDFDGVPSISLSNRDGVSVLSGIDDVAWDAVAFEPLAAQPSHRIVALGDSYSSGEGANSEFGAPYYRESDHNGNWQLNESGDLIESDHRNGCHRSKEAWSRKALLPGSSTESIGARSDQKAPDVDFHLLACSGAVTADLLPSLTAASATEALLSSTGQYNNVAQLDSGFVNEDTNLVLLTIGGNDLGFAEIFQYCLRYELCTEMPEVGPDGVTWTGRNYDDVIESRLPQVQEDVTRVLQQIRLRAGTAKIQLMGYPDLFSEGGTCVGIGQSASDWMSDLTGMLNHRLEMAALSLDSQVSFRDPGPEFLDRGTCASDNAIDGFRLDMTDGDIGVVFIKPLGLEIVSAQSLHPNRSGTTLYAEALNSALRESRVNLSATVQAGAPTTYYGTFRYHDGGTAGMRLTDIPACSDEIRIGMRIQNGNGAVGNQDTTTLVWSSGDIDKTKYFEHAWSTANRSYVPAGHYAMNARLPMATGCSSTAGLPWSGVLRW